MSKIIYNSDQRPRGGFIGLYQKNCEECTREFFAKSQFAKTCGPNCRNKKNYRLRSLKYAHELYFTKQYFSNAKILGKLYNEKHYEVPVEVLYAYKFNFDIKPEELDSEFGKVRLYGQYGLIRLTEKTFKIVKKA